MSQQVGSTKPKVGRPPAIDDQDMVDTLLAHLASGMTKKDACDLTGISYGWFAKACAIGREGQDPRYVEFLKAVKRARQQCVSTLVSYLQRNAEKGCATSAIFLLKCEKPSLMATLLGTP